MWAWALNISQAWAGTTFCHFGWEQGKLYCVATEWDRNGKTKKTFLQFGTGLKYYSRDLGNTQEIKKTQNILEKQQNKKMAIDMRDFLNRSPPPLNYLGTTSFCILWHIREISEQLTWDFVLRKFRGGVQLKKSPCIFMEFAKLTSWIYCYASWKNINKV